MVTIELNLNSDEKKVKIKDEVLFNALLMQNKTLIKKIIKSIDNFYKISDAFFEVVNNFVDFDEKNVSLYAGLIIRTGIDKYVSLFLEGSSIDEEYLIKVIDEYIRDIGDYKPKEVDVTTLEVKREAVLSILKKL